MLKPFYPIVYKLLDNQIHVPCPMTAAVGILRAPPITLERIPKEAIQDKQEGLQVRDERSLTATSS